jgi:putative sterol carrier protein
MDLKKIFEVDLSQKLRSEPDLLSDVTEIYQITIGQESWHIDFKNSREVLAGAHPQASLSIEMPLDVFEKMLAGRLNVAWALTTRKIKFSGSLHHLARIKELFA